jgi:arginyl-tRNA synthetase
MNLLKLLQGKLQEALTSLVPDPAPYALQVKATTDTRHGDYQANCAMSLAKVLGKPPRAVAETIVQQLPLGDVLDTPEIAGPGFINLKLRPEWLAARVQEMGRDDGLGVEQDKPARRIVIDYGSPNVAKPMHVGHLRSTIIGDSIARLLRFLGHEVIADNHLGDWGNQFGMLLYGYKHFRDDAALRADPVREMVRLYLKVRSLIKPAEADDEEESGPSKHTPEQIAEAKKVQASVREETAKLHAGDAENLELWRQFMPWCMKEIEPIYERLDVHYQYQLGESHYHPMLAGIVQDLLDKGIARPSEGAIVVEFDAPPPALVRYRTGAYSYVTSDLATVRLRVEDWKADEILYVVGAPQALHLKQLFQIAQRWGYGRVKFEHITFGSVLEKDAHTGKTQMFRTRGGRVVELAALLDEAVNRAEQAYRQSCEDRRANGHDVPDLSREEYQQVVEAVGLGAVKYADLSQNRTTDYIFDWHKMLAMEGNTATYMQYAYARNRNIFRKGNEDSARFHRDPPLPSLEQPQERALAVQLLRLGDALNASASEYKPNLITAYLWDVAKTYSSFYDKCPVLNASTGELRNSRLLLCDLTARVIQKGLGLLGIRTVERM